MKVFGKDVFNKKAVEELYDFAKHGLINGSSFNGPIAINTYAYAVQAVDNNSMTNMAEEKTPEDKRESITPKDLYKLEALNTPALALNCDPKYITEQVALLYKKIKLLPKADPNNAYEGKVGYGRLELESVAIRLTNRTHYATTQDFFGQYPYTTSETIDKVVKDYKNLQTSRVEDFVPDLPKDAIEAIDSYNAHIKAMCGKKGVFYIIADRKDFHKQMKKRDPVLLAQSPFGLTWQILGAWDEEMVLLEEL